MEALLRSFIHLAGAAARRCSAVVPEVHLAQDLLLVEVAARASAYGPHSPAFAKAVGYISSAWSHQDLVMHQFFVTAATKSKAAIASSPSYSLLQGSGAKNAISLSCTRSAGLPYGFSNVALGKMPPVNVMSPTGIQSVVYWKGASFAGAARLWPGPTSLFAQSIQASPISQVKRRVGPHSMLLLGPRLFSHATNGHSTDPMKPIGYINRLIATCEEAQKLLATAPILLELYIEGFNSLPSTGKLGIISIIVSLSTAACVGYCMSSIGNFKLELSDLVKALITDAKKKLTLSVNEELTKSATFRADHAEHQLDIEKSLMLFIESYEFMELLKQLMLENEQLKSACSVDAKDGLQLKGTDGIAPASGEP